MCSQLGVDRPVFVGWCVRSFELTGCFVAGFGFCVVCFMLCVLCCVISCFSGVLFFLFSLEAPVCELRLRGAWGSLRIGIVVVLWKFWIRHSSPLKITKAVVEIVRVFEASGGQFRWLQSLSGQMGPGFHKASAVDSVRQPSRIALVTPKPSKLKSLHVLTYSSLVWLRNPNKNPTIFSLSALKFRNAASANATNIGLYSKIGCLSATFCGGWPNLLVKYSSATMFSLACTDPGRAFKLIATSRLLRLYPQFRVWISSYKSGT